MWPLVTGWHSCLWAQPQAASGAPSPGAEGLIVVASGASIFPGAVGECMLIHCGAWPWTGRVLNGEEDSHF